MYKCDSCGFRARQFYWHCPACGSGTYAPRRTEEKVCRALNTESVVGPARDRGARLSGRKERARPGRSLTPELCRLKVGKELFTAAGRWWSRRSWRALRRVSRS